MDRRRSRSRYACGACELALSTELDAEALAVAAAQQHITELTAALAALRGAEARGADEDLLADLTDAQRALLLLANQLERHSVPFVPDAERATAKARADLDRLARLEANAMKAATQAFQEKQSHA